MSARLNTSKTAIDVKINYAHWLVCLCRRFIEWNDATTNVDWQLTQFQCTDLQSLTFMCVWWHVCGLFAYYVRVYICLLPPPPLSFSSPSPRSSIDIWEMPMLSLNHCRIEQTISGQPTIACEWTVTYSVSHNHFPSQGVLTNNVTSLFTPFSFQSLKFSCSHQWRPRNNDQFLVPSSLCRI